mmetsp:Transcript_39327/g.80613  ORF Transcript_39327/g.80613 Transcript_39327/m.80613 type:complete len:123 (-) Transcript_39327:923-1291(-)
MPQNHHRDVLRPLKAVKLVVVLLTQFDKALTITEHPNIYYMYVLAPVVSRISRRVRVSPRTTHSSREREDERREDSRAPLLLSHHDVPPHSLALSAATSLPSLFPFQPPPQYGRPSVDAALL